MTKEPTCEKATRRSINIPLQFGGIYSVSRLTGINSKVNLYFCCAACICSSIEKKYLIYILKIYTFVILKFYYHENSIFKNR
jgi:hypothetical protein